MADGLASATQTTSAVRANIQILQHLLIATNSRKYTSFAVAFDLLVEGISFLRLVHMVEGLLLRPKGVYAYNSLSPLLYREIFRGGWREFKRCHASRTLKLDVLEELANDEGVEFAVLVAELCFVVAEALNHSDGEVLRFEKGGFEVENGLLLFFKPAGCDGTSWLKADDGGELIDLGPGDMHLGGHGDRQLFAVVIVRYE